MPSRRIPLVAVLFVLVGVTASVEHLLAQSADYPPTMMPQEGADFVEGDGAGTSNQMLWQQYQALQTGATCQECSDCQSCSGSGTNGYNRCGCNTELFPWISGPGTCDQWCVGPKWSVDAGGLMMFRDDADWGSVAASIGGATTSVGQFDHGPGGRVFVTGYNDSGFGIQVGYEGINDWDANLAFAPVAGTTRDIAYQSSLNSVEINFLRATSSPWKLFSGFRYLQLNEDFIDTTRADRVLPAPATPAGTSQTIDQGLNRLLKNRLFGVQLGGRRDAWELGRRVTLQTYANAGMYCNKFRRDDVDLTVTTTITGDDTATPGVTEQTESSSSFRTSSRNNLTDIAFVGEAGITASWRLNHCTAVRTGYQVLAMDGVGNALEASLTPGLNSDTMLFHGMQFGLEYRR